ncbi:MAG: integrase core domain-containing protein, partial [Oscillospiraceae bacterium]|nr:integrase core domain-containing protein [Oscillospiraceae bacterium]
QTDNGTEFTYKFISDETPCPFDTALEEADIAHKLIPPRTPWHNGKVERQHRTDQQRFYDSLRMFSLADGRKQLAKYDKQSNDSIKTCLGLKSPNDLPHLFLALL